MTPAEGQELLRQQQARRAEQVAVVLDVALRVVTRRVLTLAALFAVTGMFGWAMVQGGYDRLAVAGVFAVACWCLVNLSKGDRP